MAKQTVLAAPLKIWVDGVLGLGGVLGIVKVVGIVSVGLDLADLARVGGTRAGELARGTLEALLHARLEKLDLIRMLFDAVRHSEVFLETMALGGIRVAIADGTGCGRCRTGSLGSPFGSELMDEEVDSGVEFIVGVSSFGEGDVAGFTVRVVVIAAGGVVPITAVSLVAPEGFLGSGLGGTGKCKIIRQGGTNKFGQELPTLLGMLPVVIDLLGKPIGVNGVADNEVQTIFVRARSLFALFEIEEVKTTLDKLQERFVVLLARP